MLKLKEGEETKLTLILEHKIWHYLVVHGNLNIVFCIFLILLIASVLSAVV